jgi:tetratricopeptide (TPR) repeat protein
MPKQTNSDRLQSSHALMLVGALSVIGLPIASRGNVNRFVLVASLAVASFMLGTLLGFLFTSYGEEAGTVGKIRDWLVGGITGVTIVKAAAIKGVLIAFASGPGPNEYALVMAIAVSYSTFGFFYMFLQRELILNLLLAESRAARGRLEGTLEASIVVQRLLVNVPASILSGSEDIDVVETLNKSEAETLRNQLYGEDVGRFLIEAENAIKCGRADWQTIALAANLYCYRTYFETDSDARAQEARMAACWIDRALLINPEHVDLTVKKAAILGELKDSQGTVAILEMLNRKPEAPYFVRQWLGYYLLEFPDRLDDAIRYSESYHALIPDETDSLFNLAAAYGRKYCASMRTGTQQADPGDRAAALKYLEQAIRDQPSFAPTVKDKWTRTDGCFACLAKDSDFIAILDSVSGHVEA